MKTGGFQCWLGMVGESVEDESFFWVFLLLLWMNPHRERED